MDTPDLTEDSETSVSTGLQGFWLIYDGECPVCRSVAHAFAIRKKYGAMALVDARASPDHPLCRRATAAGLDLDEGMVIFADGQIYHGADVAAFLAKFGDPSHWLTKLGRAVNCSTGASTTIYGILRGLRNLLLRLRGIGRIDNLRRPDQPIFGWFWIWRDGDSDPWRIWYQDTRASGSAPAGAADRNQSG